MAKTEKQTKSHTAEFIRNERWDEITYTREQLAKMVEAIEDDAMMEAAKRVWDKVKDKVVGYWHRMRGLRYMRTLDRDTDKEARRQTKQVERHLEAYDIALGAMGCELTVTRDWLDGQVIRVTLTRDNCVMGCIADNR